jgi:alpha-tubulin suppressor-like RCC1 family protein
MTAVMTFKKGSQSLIKPLQIVVLLEGFFILTTKAPANPMASMMHNQSSKSCIMTASVVGKPNEIRAEGSGSNIFTIQFNQSACRDFTLWYEIGSNGISGTHFSGFSTGLHSLNVTRGTSAVNISYQLPENAGNQGERELSFSIQGTSDRHMKLTLGHNKQIVSILDNDVSYLNVLQITVRDSHSCGILNNNTLKCWGYNGWGQLGDGTTVNRSSPVTIDSGTGYQRVSAGYHHVCGITSSSALKCWGRNNSGQLGDGTTIMRTTPISIDGSTSYQRVSSGYYYTCGITTSGVLKCWGDNASGQLGDGTTVNKTSPSVIDSGTGYHLVVVGDYHSCGITTSYTLNCWGYNGYGQLGDGTTILQSSPAVIDNGINYLRVAAGGRYTCGITTTNTLKCWGRNSFNNL